MYKYIRMRFHVFFGGLIFFSSFTDRAKSKKFIDCKDSLDNNNCKTDSSSLNFHYDPQLFEELLVHILHLYICHRETFDCVGVDRLFYL